MDFRQVRYFLAVAEHENFRRASEAVNVAQSALSRHVLEMEERLGAPLFDRLPTGVRLTQAGRVFAEEVRRAMDIMERAETRARKAARGEIDRLTIATNDIGARNRDVAHSVRAFSECYPEVQLDFISMVSQDQLTALHFGKIDAAVLIERPESPDLNHVTLATDPFWIALPRQHPLAELPSVPIAALIGQPFVSVTLAAYWLPQTRLLAQCRNLGLVPKIVQEASNDQMQISFIAAGIGVGFVNSSIVDLLATDVLLKRVDELTVSLRLDLVWSRSSRSSSLPHFVDVVRRELGASRNG